jgi:hypothetical protein
MRACLPTCARAHIHVRRPRPRSCHRCKGRRCQRRSAERTSASNVIDMLARGVPRRTPARNRGTLPARVASEPSPGLIWETTHWTSKGKCEVESVLLFNIRAGLTRGSAYIAICLHVDRVGGAAYRRKSLRWVSYAKLAGRSHDKESKGEER